MQSEVQVHVKGGMEVRAEDGSELGDACVIVVCRCRGAGAGTNAGLMAEENGKLEPGASYGRGGFKETLGTIGLVGMNASWEVVFVGCDGISIVARAACSAVQSKHVSQMPTSEQVGKLEGSAACLSQGIHEQFGGGIKGGGCIDVVGSTGLSRGAGSCGSGSPRRI